MSDRSLNCPMCGYFLVSTNAPWGRIKAYCRGTCRRFVYVYLGKPPEQSESEVQTAGSAGLAYTRQ